MLILNIRHGTKTVMNLTCQQYFRINSRSNWQPMQLKPNKSCSMWNKISLHQHECCSIFYNLGEKARVKSKQDKGRCSSILVFFNLFIYQFCCQYTLSKTALTDVKKSRFETNRHLTAEFYALNQNSVYLQNHFM